MDRKARIAISSRGWDISGRWWSYPPERRPKAKEDQILEVTKSEIYYCADYNRITSYKEIVNNPEGAQKHIEEIWLVQYGHCPTTCKTMIKKILKWFIKTVDEEMGGKRKRVRSSKEPKIHYRCPEGQVLGYISWNTPLTVCGISVPRGRTTRVRRKVTCERCKKSMK
jgi:hypothetical protein